MLAHFRGSGPRVAVLLPCSFVEDEGSGRLDLDLDEDEWQWQAVREAADEEEVNGYFGFNLDITWMRQWFSRDLESLSITILDVSAVVGNGASSVIAGEVVGARTIWPVTRVGQTAVVDPIKKQLLQTLKGLAEKQKKPKKAAGVMRHRWPGEVARDVDDDDDDDAVLSDKSAEGSASGEGDDVSDDGAGAAPGAAAPSTGAGAAPGAAAPSADAGAAPSSAAGEAAGGASSAASGAAPSSAAGEAAAGGASAARQIPHGNDFFCAEFNRVFVRIKGSETRAEAWALACKHHPASSCTKTCGVGSGFT